MEWTSLVLSFFANFFLVRRKRTKEAHDGVFLSRRAAQRAGLPGQAHVCRGVGAGPGGCSPGAGSDAQPGPRPGRPHVLWSVLGAWPQDGPPLLPPAGNGGGDGAAARRAPAGRPQGLRPLPFQGVVEPQVHGDCNSRRYPAELVSASHQSLHHIPI